MTCTLLLKNPLVDSYPNIPLKSEAIISMLGTDLRLPPRDDHKPFIFSCFALSCDGKLCYPDKPSGFNIANSNHRATLDEKYADWWSLMLARSISNALIVGSNSLKIESGSYTPLINIPELIQARRETNLPLNLWTIVISRNLANIDLSQILFADPEFPVIICCSTEIMLHDIPPSYTYKKLSELTSELQLEQKNIVYIDTDYITMFKIFKLLKFDTILNESPYLHHLLLEQHLLDEVWLNYSGSYIGGAVTTLGDKQNSFTSDNHPDTEILTLHHIDYHFLYSRQKILY